MLRYLLFAQCAILLASFEGIVCPRLDFAMRNFGIADIYNDVQAEGDAKTGHFIFNKDNTANSYRQHVVQYSMIFRDTVIQEGNNPCIVSFYVNEEPNANFNIKFKEESQARYYVENGVTNGQRYLLVKKEGRKKNVSPIFPTLPDEYEITWGRIYSNWQPVKMAYFHLSDNDTGYKVIDYKNYLDENARFSEVPFIFMRSEIDNAFKTKPPLTIYIRNTKRHEDYEIGFFTLEDMEAFRKLFPTATYHEFHKTAGYYQMR